jgi:hypothetical protein
LAALNRSQQEDLVAAALDLIVDDHKAVAIAGLGTGLMALEESQQQKLVTALTGQSPGSEWTGAVVALMKGDRL